MACITSQACGVFGGCDLGDPFRLGAVGLMTACTNHGGIELWRLDGRGIIGVSGLRTVAGLARHGDMFTELFLIDNLGVACLANIASGMRDRACRDFFDGIGTVMAVLAKRAGHDRGAEDNESNQGDGDDGRQPDQVFDIFEQIRILAPDRNGANRITAMILDTGIPFGER